MKTIFGAMCCLSLALCGTVAAQKTKALTNQDVLAMLKAGLDEGTVMMAIQSNPEDFDLSPVGLIELKSGNVSERVIRAMLDKRAATQGGTAASATSPGGSSTATEPPSPIYRSGPAIFRAFPIDFSADSFTTLGANATAASLGKVFVGQGRLRMENAKAALGTTIVDPLKPAAYTTLPGKAPQVMTVFQGVRGFPAMTPGASKYLLPVDPQDPCANWDTVDCTGMGTETLDGRATTKWDLTHRFQDTVWHSYVWVDVRLHVVSKRQFQENVFQLRNIVEGPQAASLFQTQ
jgi:hypothetical protein